MVLASVPSCAVVGGRGRGTLDDDVSLTLGDAGEAPLSLPFQELNGIAEAWRREELASEV